MKEFLKKHATKKRVIGLSAVALVSAVGVHAFTKPVEPTKYVTAAATRGLLVTSITGSGQVSGENQIDVKPQGSGKVMAVNVKTGQQVKKDDILVKLDQTDALKAVRDAAQSVRDANISLASAKLSLDKLKQPPTATQLLQAQDAVNAAQRAYDKLNGGANTYDVQQAENAIPTAYTNAVIALKSATQSLQKSLTDADSVIAVDNKNANASFASLFSVLDSSKKILAETTYPGVKDKITAVKSAVDLMPSAKPDQASVDAALTQTEDALQSTSDLLSTITDALRATLTSSSFSQSSLDSLTSMITSDRTDVNSKFSSLVSQQQSILSAKTALEKLQEPADPKDLAAAQEKITEAQQQLNDLKNGATAIDIQMAQNSVDSRNSALVAAVNKWHDAQAALDNYNVRAPYDGIAAKISVQVGDSASAGAAVVTMIAKQKIADISLNEVDAAKVKVGQKATLTFDAVPGLTISGEVSEIATIGTVTQGVVNYDVKIGFDTQDNRVLPGMSVSAAIITNTVADAILVPNAAVKTQGGQSYVQFLDGASSTNDGTPQTGTPRRQMVEIGLSNDSQTAITSGVNEGDHVIVQTIVPSTTKTAATGASTSGVRIPGLTGGSGGGNAVFRGGGRIGGGG